MRRGAVLHASARFNSRVLKRRESGARRGRPNGIGTRRGLFCARRGERVPQQAARHLTHGQCLASGEALQGLRHIFVQRERRLHRPTVGGRPTSAQGRCVRLLLRPLVRAPLVELAILRTAPPRTAPCRRSSQQPVAAERVLAVRGGHSASAFTAARARGAPGHRELRGVPRPGLGVDLRELHQVGGVGATLTRARGCSVTRNRRSARMRCARSAITERCARAGAATAT